MASFLRRCFSISSASVLFWGIAIRVALTLLGIWLDENTSHKYTDIDYVVFSEAAIEVYEGNSPYDRATYRYTPLLAWMMLPNVWWPSFGKHVFSVVDALIGVFTILILRARGLSDRNAALFAATFLFHPFAVNVSSRGNADSLVCLLVILVLYFLCVKHLDAAAIVYGLAVHFKIYPIVYALPILLFLGPDYAPEDFAVPGTPEAHAAWDVHGCLCLALGKPFSAAVRGVSWVVGAACGIPVGAAAQAAAERARPGSTRVHPMLAPLAWSLRTVHTFFTPRRIGFGVLSGITFLALLAVFYAMYGWTFLYETYLHHLVRADNRHNFSPYFYYLYLDYDSPLARTGVGLISFLPQFGTVAALGALYARDLPFAWFLQTAVFVTWNKVITVQYFHWYLCLAPFVLPQSKFSYVFSNRRVQVAIVLLGAAWLFTELHWNLWAFHLELRGQSTFAQVWLAGLLFLLANIAALIAFVRFHRTWPVFANGKLLPLPATWMQREWTTKVKTS